MSASMFASYRRRVRPLRRGGPVPRAQNKWFQAGEARAGLRRAAKSLLGRGPHAVRNWPSSTGVCGEVVTIPPPTRLVGAEVATASVSSRVSPPSDTGSEQGKRWASLRVSLAGRPRLRSAIPRLARFDTRSNQSAHQMRKSVQCARPLDSRPSPGNRASTRSSMICRSATS